MPDNRVLPAVRVPTVTANDLGEDGPSETPIVDLPPSEKFGFTFPENYTAQPSLPPSTSQVEQEASEVESSEAEYQESKDLNPMIIEKEPSEHTSTTDTPTAGSTPIPLPSPPRLSRAFSMPLPSQLGGLSNPHRIVTPTSNLDTSYFSSIEPLVLAQPPSSARFRELSIELADSVQMVVQTLLQISPPHLLDPAKEQFAACSLSVPSPSISAMLTALKNLNYMSANMTTFADDTQQQPETQFSELDNNLNASVISEDFDIGEMLQSVGDALSGLAAQAGVELVLYHSDVGMRHVSVRGDECGVSYSLSHIIRQILDTSHPGDTIEIGLSIFPESAVSSQEQSNSDNGSRSSSRASSSVNDFEGPLRCTFEVCHKFVSPGAKSSVKSNLRVAVKSSLLRTKPHFESVIFRRLLARIRGTLKSELEPKLFSSGRCCAFSVPLESGSPELLTNPPNLSAEEAALRQPYASMNIQLASEPCLSELLQFVETLKGKKVTLHANSDGSFAHHLTSYLTTWGLDVSHVSLSAPEDTVQEASAENNRDDNSRPSPAASTLDSAGVIDINPAEEQIQKMKLEDRPAFIIIDDDVNSLRQRLVQLRAENTFNLNLRRPQLAAQHRPKSSPQIYRTKGVKSTFAVTQYPVQHPVVIHFTGLQNFKLVKDLIHSVMSTPCASNYVPEVIVLPKPAGPRRVLTALRTAVIKPVVDPFFTPIATSPLSPSGLGINPFSPFSGSSPSSQKPNRPPISPRTASDRSSRNLKEAIEAGSRLPPSPLRDSDSVGDYFDKEAKKLGTSPSSGLIIQSVDGQPAGIFFNPQGPRSRSEITSEKIANPPTLTRESGNLKPPKEDHRKISSRRVTSATMEDDMSPGERPKPNSLAQFDRFRVAPNYFPEVMVTGREELLVLSKPTSDNTGEVSRTSPPADGRKSMSPPTSPVTNRTDAPSTPIPSKRLQRRGTIDLGNSPVSPQAKRSKPSDGNIVVPPVHVLIVEDNPINQTILCTFMKKKKIKYDVAINGAEAVAKWKTGGFHLILMDIQMPVMDGIEATKEIRRLERLAASTPPLEGQHTPSEVASTDSKSTSVHTPFRSSVIIVALTASSLQADRVAALAAGCNDFLTKPVSLLWLNNKIIEWGSIKALQMWADLRPDVARSVASGQASQAKAVASKLRVPEGRRTPRSPVATSRLLPSQMDAMRLLSSPTRITISRETEPIDSESHSEADNQVTTADNQKAPSPGSESPSMTSVVIATPPEEQIESKEVSGDEAAPSRLTDSLETEASATELSSVRRSIIGGDLSGSIPSIAEILHASEEGESSITEESDPTTSKPSEEPPEPSEQ